MSSVTTRALGGRDRFDVVAIKLDGDKYANKTGIVELVLTGYSWTSSEVGNRDYGTLDVRVPNFSNNSDNAVWDAIGMGTPTGSVVLTKKYYFAVNNGIPGPSVRVNGDNTWDLMDLTVYLTENKNDESSVAAASFTVTLSYSAINWTDYTQPMTNQVQPKPTPTTIPPLQISSALTMTLLEGTKEHIDWIGDDEGVVTASQNGWIGVKAISLVTTFIPRLVGKKTKFGREGNYDLEPFRLTIQTAPDQKHEKPIVLLDHETTFGGGTKSYQPIYFFIWALNGGKIDANGSMIHGDNGGNGFLRLQIRALDVKFSRQRNKDAQASVTFNYYLWHITI